MIPIPIKAPSGSIIVGYNKDLDREINELNSLLSPRGGIIQKTALALNRDGKTVPALEYELQLPDDVSPEVRARAMAIIASIEKIIEISEFGKIRERKDPFEPHSLR